MPAKAEKWVQTLVRHDGREYQVEHLQGIEPESVVQQAKSLYVFRGKTRNTPTPAAMGQVALTRGGGN